MLLPYILGVGAGNLRHPYPRTRSSYDHLPRDLARHFGTRISLPKA